VDIVLDRDRTRRSPRESAASTVSPRSQALPSCWSWTLARQLEATSRRPPP